MAEHVLVLVDSPDSARSIGAMLAKAGFEVTVTSDAEHATSITRTVRPSAAVLHWPGGNLTALLVGRLRTFWPLPVIVLCERDDVATRALGAGAFDTLPRLAPKESLLTAVNAAVEQGRRILNGGRERLGHYELTEILGRGGMSIVYRAVDLRDNREVALKVLRPDLTADPEYVARFEREAGAARGLKHSNLMEVYESGRERGRIFIAQELVRGTPLDRVLIERGRLEARRALIVARQVADGLAYAHERGLVHRDIKPANLVVDDLDRVKIMDFGLLKAATTDKTPITRSDEFIGTLLYAAPEQVRADPVDYRADLYALGAVLFEMLSGTRSLANRESAVLARKIASGQIPFQIGEIAHDVPEFVTAIVKKLIEPRVEDRYQSAREVITDIDRILNPA
ncbi:MAG: protein kinase [Planctomycetes bacterium]|nr:protein kinase [Planctomycetota bacterium]